MKIKMKPDQYVHIKPSILGTGEEWVVILPNRKRGSFVESLDKALALAMEYFKATPDQTTVTRNADGGWPGYKVRLNSP